MITNNERTDAQGAAEFSKDYSQKANMQHHFNNIYLGKLAQKIETQFSDKNKPLRLLDIGCGGGVATVMLYQLLKQRGYNHITIDAVDISASQIQFARDKYAADNYPIHFIEQDALSLDAQNKYDVCFSLFTLHWIDNKPLLTEKIAAALKPNGLLFYLAVTQLNDWFTIRQQALQKLLASEKWQRYFSDFKLLPFAHFTDYQSAMQHNNLFTIAEQVHHTEVLEYQTDAFLQFISSWLPELRHLKSKAQSDEEFTAMKQELFAELLAHIPTDANAANRAFEVTRQNSSVRFLQFFTTCVANKVDTQIPVPEHTETPVF